MDNVSSWSSCCYAEFNLGEVIIKGSSGLKYWKTILIDVVFYILLFIVGSLIMFSSLKGTLATFVVFIIGLIGYSISKYYVWKVLGKVKGTLLKFGILNIGIGLTYYVLLIVGYFGLGYLFAENTIRYYFTGYFLVLSGLLYYFLNYFQLNNLFNKKVNSKFKKIFFIEIGAYLLLLVLFIFFPYSWIMGIIIGSLLFVNSLNRIFMI